MIGENVVTPTLVLFGPSDRVIYPDFDAMAARCFARHVGPFRLRECGHFVPWEAPSPVIRGTIMMCADLLADIDRRPDWVM